MTNLGRPKHYATYPRKDYIFDPTAMVCTDCLQLHANGETPAEWTATEHADFIMRINRYMRTATITIGWDREQHSCDDEAEECDCEQTTFSSQQCASCGTKLAGERYGVTIWMEGREIHARNVRQFDCIIWADGDYWPQGIEVTKIVTDNGDGFIWLTTDARTYRLCPDEVVSVF